MPWIPDVVFDTTITSTWGNTIRDHVVAKFANRTVMFAQAGVADGQLAICLDERSTWERRSGTWYPLITQWRAFNRAFYWGSTANPDTATVITDSGAYAMMRRVGANCEVQYVATLTSGPTGSGSVLWAALPQAPNHGDMLGGTLKLFNNRTAQSHGPWAVWMGLKPIVFAGGTVQVPFVSVGEWGGSFYLRESASDTSYTFAMSLWFSTDNPVDTPWQIP